ncbi:MAG: hypothetical protein E7258_06430 [Lachnospiraceae bacterium]|nr:hypothetical protein [Lachnospiraceae bacterium]
MDYRMPSYYGDFVCIADKCPDSCCAGWAIVIDDKTMDKYNAMPGEAGEFVRTNIDYDNQVFKRCNGKCAFLRDDKLCELIIKTGEDKLCKTCRRYPRHFEEYGNLVEAALSMSCPVAAKMIITKKEVDSFLIRHTDKESPHKGEVDYYLLESLIQIRRRMFLIMGDRSKTVWQRIESILELGERIQPLIYEYEGLGLKSKFKRHRNKILDKITKICDSDIRYRQGLKTTDCQLMKNFIDMLLGLENINQQWPEMIENVKETLYNNLTSDQYKDLKTEFDEYMKDREYEYEHIVVYFLYTYFFGGVYDYNVQAMVKMSVISTLIIREIGFAWWLSKGKEFTVNDNVKVAYLFSRQLEHSDENLMSLEGLLVAHPVFSIDNIFRVI